MESKKFSTFYIENGPMIAIQFVLIEDRIEGISLALRSGKGVEWSIESNRPNSPASELICKWMEEYSQEREPKVFLPYSLEKMPPYTRRVLHAMQQIPFGKVITYQELAKKTGNPRAARAVGNACGRNPFPLVIPCHRVLGSGYQLGGYSGDPQVKERLLAFEGVKVGMPLA